MPNAIDTTQQKISKVDKLKELKELLDTVLQTEEKKIFINGITVYFDQYYLEQQNDIFIVDFFSDKRKTVSVVSRNIIYIIVNYTTKVLLYDFEDEYDTANRGDRNRKTY